MVYADIYPIKETLENRFFPPYYDCDIVHANHKVKLMTMFAYCIICIHHMHIMVCLCVHVLLCLFVYYVQMCVCTVHGCVHACGILHLAYRLVIIIDHYNNTVHYWND